MIEFRNLSIQQGSFHLEDISFQVASGSYAVLMGPSGSGKTTLLEAMCGLRPIRSGDILIDGQQVTEFPPAARGIGYVPQDGALFTTMNVREQLSFGLRIRKVTQSKIRARVDELADLLGIGDLLSRSPEGLSGGERQRVALGRALAFRPSVLALDEPTSALDDETRDGILDVIRTLHEQSKATVLHISHSAVEARALADQVFRIDNGCITNDDALVVAAASSERLLDK